MIEAVEQADFLRMPRPKLLQPRRERIELSLSRRYVVQVLDQLYRGGVVGLTFGGHKCFDCLPEFVAMPDESFQIPGAGGGLGAGWLLAFALGLLACRAWSAPPPGVRRQPTGRAPSVWPGDFQVPARPAAQQLV
jgi:hypothetical protein